MEKALASPLFNIVVIPLALALVGMYAKRLARADGDLSPRRNDWAVGTSILLMLLGTLLADLRTAQTQGAAFLWLIGVLPTAFLLIDHDRFNSWKRDANEMPTKIKRMWVGIILPDLACLAIFGFYQAQKVGVL